MTGLVPMADIKIGHHVERTFLGMTFNVDTIISTLVAGVLVLILGFWATRSLTKDTEDHVPTKVQILWELVVGEVNKQVEDNLGKVHPFVAPLAISLFFFILFANWLELVPTKLNEHTHLLPAPTADTNLTYALAAVTMVSVWAYGIRQKGVKGYFKHFLEPFPVLLPLNILEELIKPITLALRLFGNIFAGGIMLALIGLIPLYAMWAPNILWKAFDAIIGVIQAFIFALLTVLYFAMAGAGHEEHESHEEHEDEQRKKKAAEAAAVSDEATPVPAH
ncbi:MULTISPECIES: F0F1 ATP synthase subunit A [unclassified Nocardioides]|uniref:F0F1 ATP synthase subunit A n=1 Tax=unclassified Nocardioides TaxID=2615069 RepID=UPI0009F09788|nr:MULTISPECIES: F0F1 ATP synthase subunit A [unclassified Nocardioides]GAW50531.1 ATP synthase subunit a [Nocardioides sp. PD653-B2]GAW56655.1 ATP synthase subunit a [Nocardioides sp. PD653]